MNDTTDKKDAYNSIIEKAVKHGRDMFDLGIDAAIEVVDQYNQEPFQPIIKEIISELKKLKNNKE